MDDLKPPAPLTQPMTIICKCECGAGTKERGKESRGFFGTFLRVFAGMSGFLLSFLSPIFVLIGLFILLAIVGASVDSSQTDAGDTFRTSFVYGTENAADKILQVPINGIILGDSSDGMDFASILYGGITYGYDVKDYLRWAAKQDEIKGVVLMINSPGGTIVGSQAVADAVAEYREVTRKPVYAHIAGLGASGAYWSAVSTDKIYADYGSVTGSIGVIMGSILYYDNPTAYGDSFGASVDTENGIKEYSLSAGKGKDFGNPFRPPSEEELRIYQSSLENEYSRFVEYVAERRGIDAQIIRDQIGAHVYDNMTAESLKLIDGSQMKEKSYEVIAESAGIENAYQVVGLEGPGFFEKLFAMPMEIVRERRVEGTREDMLKKSSFCAPKTILAYHGDLQASCAR
ncbi:MAG: endopeptidase IV [Patescibacteria group bacterium]|nr:MAG: endopeptidase IV [Patescibacteria group bacterium]